MLCHANSCLHIKLNMMLSHKKLRMLTIILVDNVSLHMYMHCVTQCMYMCKDTLSTSMMVNILNFLCDKWSSNQVVVVIS